jgi:tetratricopeptide (TPR) repeat protein
MNILEEIGDRQGIAICYLNMSNLYADKGNYSKALDYLFKYLAAKKEIGDEQGIALCFGNMGDLHLKLGNYKLALQYSDSSLQLAKKIGAINEEREAYENLAGIYAKTDKYKEAYEAHVKFKALTDSIFNADNSKQLGDLKTQFEVEKKEAELKIKSDAEQEKLIAVANEEKKRQQVVIASVAGVLLLVIVFSLFLYKRFKITEKQKKVIEEQKVLVDKAYEKLHERNKEVVDSIHYAKRIQTALITSEKYIESSLNKLMKG